MTASMDEKDTATRSASLGEELAVECVGGLFEFAFEGLGLWFIPVALVALVVVAIVAAIAAGFEQTYNDPFDRYPTSILGLNDDRK